MVTGLILIILFIVLLLLGVPVGFVVALSSLGAILYLDIPLHILPQRFFTAVDSFSLMAIPLFMVAGSLMSHGTLTRRIVNFALSFLGSIKGSLAQVVALTGIAMGGISGSGVADTAAIGSILYPEMKHRGYDEGFSAALIASSGSIGLIIPPSVALIIFGVTTQASIGDLFIAGIIPGIMIGAGFMLYSYYVARRHNYPTEGKTSLSEKIKKLKAASLALIMPLLIIIGIRGGIFTPTEGGAIISAYALFVSLFIYRDLKITDLPKIFFDAALSTATISIIICGTSLFTWLLAREQIPQRLSHTLLSITDNHLLLVILMIVILLIVGMFIDSGPAIMILAPILTPVATQIGMSLVQFGLMMVITLTIGLLTPPVGTALYVSSNISKVPIARLSKSLLPFWGIMVLIALLVAFVPGLTSILL